MRQRKSMKKELQKRKEEFREVSGEESRQKSYGFYKENPECDELRVYTGSQPPSKDDIDFISSIMTLMI
jgi:hypothetical protein